MGCCDYLDRLNAAQQTTADLRTYLDAIEVLCTADPAFPLNGNQLTALFEVAVRQTDRILDALDDSDPSPERGKLAKAA